MNRRDFEALRDLPGKRIDGAIRLVQKQVTHPLCSADRIPIANDLGASIVMNVNLNPKSGAKGINVTLVGEGPICRLDVDGTNHGDSGRSHKHAVQDEASIRRCLREGTIARGELSGQSLQEVLVVFCREAHIVWTGELVLPEGVDA